MKKVLLLLLCAIFVNYLHAQSLYSFSGGVKLINAIGNTTLWYIDESPSQDNIYMDINGTSNFAVNVNLRWADNNPSKKFCLFAEGQGYIGGLSGLALNAGYLFKSSNSSKVRLQPELGIVAGFSSKGLGEMQNNDVYIQVNNTKFKDYTNVNVSLRNAYVGVKPGVSIVFKTASEKEFGIGVNYQISYKAGYVNFVGIDDYNQRKTETELLSAYNVGFYVNGRESNNNPFNPDGLEFKIFFSF